VYISHICREKKPWTDWVQFFGGRCPRRNHITCCKFGDDWFRGLGLAEGHILPFPIDFGCHPYNTLTLPCECVIKFQRWNVFGSLG